MCRLLILLALVIPMRTMAEGVAWPDLSQNCFVKGRLATKDDVKKGCAVFVIENHGQPAGSPLDIEIPQYAIHVEDGSGIETPVIIIQAEENSSIKAVGYKGVGTSNYGVALLRELRLLGTKKPVQSLTHNKALHNR